MADIGCVPPIYYGPSASNICSGSSFVLFASLIDAMIRYTCDIGDVCGRVNAKSEPLDEYDFIVIGGGSGGSAVTGRLAETNSQGKRWRVLLIEAGPDEPESYQVPGYGVQYFDNAVVDWNYHTTNEPILCQDRGGKCPWLTSKLLGGCSVINRMMFTRGTPPDFDIRWSGAEGWSWNEVLPFFRKFENNLQIEQYGTHYHGEGGPVTISNQYYVPDLAHAIMQGAKEAGFPISEDLNGANVTGFAIAQGFIKDGVRVSMAKAYLRPQKDNDQLHIMLNSTVTRILLNKDKRAYAVEFVYNSKTYRVNAQKEIVLAAGAVNSPKILLQSGIGPKDALDAVGIEQIHDLPGVGHNLTNHVSFRMDYWINSTVNTAELSLKSLEQYINYRTGPLASPGIPVTTRLASKYTTAEDPDIQMFFLLDLKCPTNSSSPEQPELLSVFPMNLHTKSRGRITLKSSDPLDDPIMVGNYLTVTEDEDIIVEAIRQVQKLVNSKTLKEKWQFNYANNVHGNCRNEHSFDSDDYWHCAIRHTALAENHEASTLLMGPTSDKWSVLDNKLRVIGIKDLRVADASAMPEATSSNTNAPVLLIAERCADFIKQRWGF